MDAFYALAEPTRRDILELLATSGRLAAGDIYARFDVTPPAISQHLKVLREANLVRVHKQAQKRFYEINPVAILEFETWAQQMAGRFDALEVVLATEQHKRVSPKRKYKKGEKL